MSTGDALVHYASNDGVATITLDDGKVNALSPATFAQLAAALDRAEAESAAVVLAGRPDLFSAGFDLKVLTAGGETTVDLLGTGFAMAERLLAFPAPVVVAVTGHALAMGLFLVLSGDLRLARTGPWKLVANEVAIGFPMPRGATEILRQRLTPAAFNRAVILAETFTPTEAVAGGLVDRLVDGDTHEVVAEAQAAAAQLAQLDRTAHVISKQRARAGTLAAIRAATNADLAELRAGP